MAGVAVGLKATAEVEALKLPAAVEIQLMRIIQEALSNIRKHARATNAIVSFGRTADGLTIEVSDNGQGFDPERLVRTGWPRFGLQTMRERAQAIGGKCDIVSSPGHGTIVTVQVPLRSVEA
jgi:signal transduction histidine kinase